jgi:hypothetical protein
MQVRVSLPHGNQAVVLSRLSYSNVLCWLCQKKRERVRATHGHDERYGNDHGVFCRGEAFFALQKNASSLRWATANRRFPPSKDRYSIYSLIFIIARRLEQAQLCVMGIHSRALLASNLEAHEKPRLTKSVGISVADSHNLAKVQKPSQGWSTVAYSSSSSASSPARSLRALSMICCAMWLGTGS